MTPTAPASFQRSRNTTGSSSAPARKVRSIAPVPERNLACVGCLLSTFFGFGFGYIYAKKNTYFLSRDVLEAYLLGSNLQKAWSKMSSKEKQQLRTVLEK